jgi:signal transduction histidine kinase
MKKIFVHFGQTYFGRALDLRVRLFNVLATAGILVSLISAVAAAANGENFVNILISLFAGAAAIALLVYSSRSGRYQLCYAITIVLIFLVLFPFIFFIGGGIDSAMPFYFIFAVLFTISMLDGKKALLIALLELAVYIGLFVVEKNYPDAVTPLPSPQSIVIDKMVGLAAVSIALGVTMFLHFRAYIALHRKLDEQNVLLAEASRAKTEFLSNASHEMRTPLTVVSVNVQTALDILNDSAVKDPEAAELLSGAQSEIMRLSRMVGAMLTLASISESTDKQAIDLTTLLHSSAEMLRLNLTRRGNALTVNVEDGLCVFGNADLLAQVVSNLLTNAGAHTENGGVTLTASRNGGEITVSMRDTGTGISPDLLPRVFERGVSAGGTGFGLYLCKAVVESHGGRIWIESPGAPGESADSLGWKQGVGTLAHFTLPVYEGQFGGDAT